MLMSRRAWCRESGSPRSREASESNPSTYQSKRNLQILSHGVERQLANMGERDMLSRENRLSRLIQSGCGSSATSQSPHGARTKAVRPIGCKARQVRATCAGVGSLAVATPTSRGVTTSGVLPKKQTMKSSTMRGALSPCQ